jgi:hypothetical protein
MMDCGGGREVPIRFPSQPRGVRAGRDLRVLPMTIVAERSRPSANQTKSETPRTPEADLAIAGQLGATFAVRPAARSRPTASLLLVWPEVVGDLVGRGASEDGAGEGRHRTMEVTRMIYGH